MEDERLQQTFVLCMRVFHTNPKIGSSESVRGRHIGGCCCVGVEGIDISQQAAHHCRNTGTHILC